MSSQVPKPAIMKLSSDATLTMIQSVRNDPFQVCCQQLTAWAQLTAGHRWVKVGSLHFKNIDSALCCTNAHHFSRCNWFKIHKEDVATTVYQIGMNINRSSTESVRQALIIFHFCAFWGRFHCSEIDDCFIFCLNYHILHNMMAKYGHQGRSGRGRNDFFKTVQINVISESICCFQIFLCFLIWTKNICFIDLHIWDRPPSLVQSDLKSDADEPFGFNLVQLHVRSSHFAKVD